MTEPSQDPPVGWRHPQNIDCDNPYCNWAGQKFQCSRCNRTLCLCRHTDPGMVFIDEEICQDCFDEQNKK